ncbi:MAG: A/G-specific adenine glycosylase [Deltaproteobacteria bacterium]
MDVRTFRRIVYAYYKRNRRPMPWRSTCDPYRILVSEVMLQQTQVARVMEKYPEFIRAFPTVRALAEAPLARVLKVWQGMGYNRRALYLRKLARTVVAEHDGRIPRDRQTLLGLPGLGPATSACVCAFAFGQAFPFIETNIRSVFIHHFFRGKSGVCDTEILPLVEKTLDRSDPRNWYYALMDYGVHLKATRPNPSRRSSGYKKQSPLEGSVRQARARIVRYLLANKGCAVTGLLRLSQDRALAAEALEGLERDRLVAVRDGRVRIA